MLAVKAAKWKILYPHFDACKGVEMTCFANLFAVLLFLIVRLPQGYRFLSHLITREFTAPTLVVNSVVKETTSTKACIFTEQTQNIFCCILSQIGRIQCATNKICIL
jgi:hypothetical protein